MACLIWLWYPLSDIEQNIKEPRYITKGIKEVAELKENLSDIMSKTSEGELSEIHEGLLVHRYNFNVK